MNKVFIYLLIISCTDISEQVIIASKNSSLDCHMCPGYIVIKKGNIIDTLEMGSWGSPPNFEQFQYRKQDFVVFNSGYFSGGITESFISIMSLNEDNYLKVIFDTLVSDNRINELNIKRHEIDFIVPDKLIINQYVDSYNLKDEGSVKKDLKEEIIILSSYLTLK